MIRNQIKKAAMIIMVAVFIIVIILIIDALYGCHKTDCKDCIQTITVNDTIYSQSKITICDEWLIHLGSDVWFYDQDSNWTKGYEIIKCE